MYKITQAKYINQRLGLPLFSESEPSLLKPNLFTKTEINKMCIDDLINEHGRLTQRGVNIIVELLDEYKAKGLNHV